ncbi:MAG: hypothetical protein JWQ81_6359 [Amycolatopsis sp.]|uniref:outer membrane protein assembly factor BamB family protein n=1 Tax=Amycolatopsis sp. TaxID=37632 RepID=UPI00262EE861|nr:PQQ-binding-like beta-propeller repeat protein [Amycolatopsis sp.]MCU1685620.1 hypothetical protein [Amycolatopsis sp.]
MKTIGRKLVTAGALVLVCSLAAACTDAQPVAKPVSSLPSLSSFPAGAPGVASWTPWPSALHDARHSGSSAVDGPRTGNVRWRRTLEGAVTPGPVVGADGTIYVSSNAGVLHALDPATGADRWTFDTGKQGGGDLSSSPLVLSSGVLLVPTAGNELVAVSPSGARLWSETLSGEPTSPVSVDGKRVYVGDTSGSVTALDVASAHRVVWTVQAGSVSYGSVVTDGSGRLYTTAGSALVAIDDRGASAAVAWRADPGDDITEVSAGLAADGTALLGTNGTREWAYHHDGTPAWNAQRAITYSSPAVTASGLAYVGDHAELVHVFDVRTGAELARYGPVGAQIWSSTVLDRAYDVYFGGQNGHADGYDVGGKRLFDVDLGAPIDGYPALTADAALIIGARNGVLTAIG